MLHIETQSQLVDVTAAMMRSCFTATANTWAALACHGLSFWASMLGAGSRSASRPLDWTAWSRIAVPACNDRIDATAEPGAAPPRATGFSSYRSDGGHAVAQIASLAT